MNLELCLIIVFKLYVVAESNSEYVLDKIFLKNVLNVVYNSKDDILRGKVFLSELWPKLSSLIPLSITQEHVRVTSNLCTDIKFQPKLNEILNINFEANLEGKEKYVVEAKLEFIGPVVFKIDKDCSAEQNHLTPTMSYSIKSSKVKFSVLVPDFNHEKEDKISTECIVIIDSIAIEELGKYYRILQRKRLAEADIKEAISISIMVSLTEKLEPAEDGNNSNMEVKPEPERASICLSQNLNSKVFTFMGHHYNDQKTHGSDDFPLMYEVKVIVDYGKKVSYAKINIFESRMAIQICIKNSIESLLSEPKRGTTVKPDDFFFIEPTVIRFRFPNHAAHTFSMELVFNSYAPLIYKHLRDFFGVDSRYFVTIFCSAPLRESSSAGNSGSTFYISQNKEIIAKTIEQREVDQINLLLPKYVLHVFDDKPSLLPKFYGVYTFYQPWKITNLMVTNSVFPSDVMIHLKYDLKGSLFLRKAKRKSRSENLTYRDVDFREQHPKGIFLKPDHREELLKIIKRDSRFLRKSGITDYSLLLGIHFVDKSRESYRREDVIRGGEDENEDDDSNDDGDPTKDIKDEHGGEDDNDDDDISMQDSLADDRHGDKTKDIKDKNYFKNLVTAGIPATTADGKEIIIYVGIIDMLQTYKLDKKIVHYFLYLFTHPDKITIQHPQFYAWRFRRFLETRVFKKQRLGHKS